MDKMTRLGRRFYNELEKIHEELDIEPPTIPYWIVTKKQEIEKQETAKTILAYC